jgi:adenine/guanine phosphoribosyltransferase-like PRPP-binding protein
VTPAHQGGGRAPAPHGGTTTPASGGTTAPASGGAAGARLGGACAVVEEGLGLTWRLRTDPYGTGFAPLVALALRDNPKRAQLVVSTVLGKHLPVAPAAAIAAAERLAALVPSGSRAVLGYCETATSLGHLVAEALAAPYVHTTRRPDPAVPAFAGFDEEHSHAVAHTLQPRPEVLDGADTVVLVDDELTTGTTALNTIAALQPLLPGVRRWVVASLLDLREEAARTAFEERAAALGQVDVVALVGGELLVPADVGARAAELRRSLAAVPSAPVPAGRGAVVHHDLAWPDGVPLGGRTGVLPAQRSAQEEWLAATAERLPLSGGPLLVLGTEELMWAPLRLAALLPGPVFHSTTRSPVLPADLAGYAVHRALHFPAPDEPSRGSRLHGLPATAYADVVVVTDTPAAAADPLAQALRPWASERVHVVSL